MYRKNIKSLFVCVIIFALVFSFIPFGNFVANAQETNEGKSGKSSEKKPIEIIEKRTPTSKTFDNLDGTYSSEISQQPIHFKDENGKWEEIDNKLIEKENNKIQNTANDFTVEFVEKVLEDDAALSISDNEMGIKMGLVETNDKEQKEKSVNEVTGTVDGNSITYKQLADNFNVVYTVGADRVKEDIIYTEMPENGFPEKFTYQVSLDGLEAQTIGQAIYLVDPETKEKKYLIEAPYMYDSFLPEGYIQNELIPSIPEEAKSYNLNLETRIEDGQLYMDLIPDTEWLNDEKRQYPITIDPTIIRLQGDTKVTTDTTIRSSFPTTTGGNDNDLGIGTANDGNIVRSLLRFDLTAIPAATTIVSADLNLWFTSTNSASPIDINLQKVTKAWEENEATWNKSKSSTGWAIPGGDYAGTKLSTVSGLTSPPDINNALTNWHVPISVVQGWLTDSSTNFGFLLKSSNESTKIYKKFASSEQNVANKYKPQLVITYKTTARLGLEDYWEYDLRPLTDGSNSVNITTLNNILQYTDLSILGYADFGLDFTRTYNSKDYEKSLFGYGWSFTGDEKIFINTGGDNSKLQYKDADGTIHVFSYDATYGVYGSPDGNYDKLVRKDGTYILTDPYGYKTTFNVRESTNDTDVKVAYISSQEDRNGNVIHYEYDELNRLKAIYTDLGLELGHKLEFDYNNLGLISKSQYNGELIKYEYTPSGYLQFVKVSKSSSNDGITETVSEFKYTNNRITAVIDPEGNKNSFQYEENSDLKSVTETLEYGVASPPTVYTLDRANSMTIITSPEGEVTRYHVNDNYSIDHIYFSSGEEINYKLDRNYQIIEKTTIVDGKISTVKNSYDLYGNLLSITDADGKVEAYTYTSYQNIETYKDATGLTTNYKYNDFGDLQEFTVPTEFGKTVTISYSYNAKGELIKMTSSDGIEETYSTDYSGTPVTKTTTHKDAFNNITRTVTDLNENVLKTINGKSQLTDFKYNFKNELTAVTAKDQTTNYLYDKNGNLVSVMNPLGSETNYEYNGQNQIISEKNGEGQVTAYDYNADGNLTEIKKPDNQIIQFGTTEAENLSTVSVNGTEMFVKRTDGADIIIDNKVLDTSVRSKYFDNGLLQTVKFNEQSTNAINYTYHGNESVATIEYGNTLLERQIDNSQNVITLKFDGTQVGFGYNDNGLLTNINYNGVANVTKDYENGARLNKESFFIKDKSSLWKQFTYEYDANHNISSINGNEVIYSYDALNLLESEIYSNGTSIQYTYDAAGNRKTKITSKMDSTTYDRYDYNAANQLIRVNDEAYEVDKNGNLLKDDKFRYAWNAFDQLTKVSSIEGATVAEYHYDDQGRRVFKRLYENDTSFETFYRYNGTSKQVLFEEDANGNITKSYTYDDNSNPLTMTYEDKTYYYLTNYRGDVLALVNEAGENVANYTYDAWGNILTQSGIMASENPYRYAGYRYDEKTQLYYLMSRYYNPDTGVFLSLDPIRGDITNPVTLNGYIYVGNNPVNFDDPNGTNGNPLVKIVKGIIFVQTSAYVTVQVGKQYVKKKVTMWVAKRSAISLLRLSDDAIEYAVGNTTRMQHAFKHAKDLGFGNWNKKTGQQWSNYVSNILKTATKSFDNKLGQDAVRGYYKVDKNGYNVAVYVYKDGPKKGRVATVVRLTENQMIKFGLK